MDDIEEDTGLDDLVNVLILTRLENVQKLKKVDNRKYQPLLRRRILAGVILRRALLDPSKSPFAKVYNSGDDASLVSFTGLDYKLFRCCFR